MNKPKKKSATLKQGCGYKLNKKLTADKLTGKRRYESTIRTNSNDDGERSSLIRIEGV